MRYTRSAAFTVFLAVAVFAIAIAIFGTVHAQPPLLGQLFGHLFPRYDTAPISGDVFRCYVTNVGTLPAYVVDIFIYDGSTGETIGAGDTISSNGSVYTVPDCDTSFEPFLLEPHQTCGIVGAAPNKGSALNVRAVAHCQFRAGGEIRGAIQSTFVPPEDGYGGHIDYTGLILRADAKLKGEY